MAGSEAEVADEALALAVLIYDLLQAQATQGQVVFGAVEGRETMIDGDFDLIDLANSILESKGLPRPRLRKPS
jgi:hypothetical protein